MGEVVSLGSRKIRNNSQILRAHLLIFYDAHSILYPVIIRNGGLRNSAAGKISAAEKNNIF